MKTLKLNEKKYTAAVKTIAASLIAMAQEDYADDFADMDQDEIDEQLADVVEEYSGDMLLDLKTEVSKLLDSK